MYIWCICSIRLAENVSWTIRQIDKEVMLAYLNHLLFVRICLRAIYVYTYTVHIYIYMTMAWHCSPYSRIIWNFSLCVCVRVIVYITTVIRKAFIRLTAQRSTIPHHPHVWPGMFNLEKFFFPPLYLRYCGVICEFEEV